MKVFLLRSNILSTIAFPSKVTVAKLVENSSNLLVSLELKKLIIYDLEKLCEINSTTIIKKSTTLLIRKTPDCYKSTIMADLMIIAADKVGEVKIYPYPQLVPNYLILGHCASIITDLLITDDEKYIISCDRDEKIRISQYYRPTIIETYLLGHTQYISHIIVINEKLISCSGDGTMIVWDFTKNVVLQSLDLHSYTDKPLVSFIFQKSNCELVFHLKNTNNLFVYNLDTKEMKTIELVEPPLFISQHKSNLSIIYRLSDPQILNLEDELKISENKDLIVLVSALKDHLKDYTPYNYDEEYSKKILEKRYDPLPGPEITTTLTPL